MASPKLQNSMNFIKHTFAFVVVFVALALGAEAAAVPRVTVELSEVAPVPGKHRYYMICRSSRAHGHFNADQFV